MVKPQVIDQGLSKKKKKLINTFLDIVNFLKKNEG